MRVSDIEHVIRKRLAEVLGKTDADIDPNVAFEGLKAEWTSPATLHEVLAPILAQSCGIRTLYLSELKHHRTIWSLATYLSAELSFRPPTHGFVSLLDAGYQPLIPPLIACESDPKNRSCVFLLGVGRSGTTLLRNMLNQHPNLAAPPELHLLNFQDMGQRRRILHKAGIEWVRMGLAQAFAEFRSRPLTEIWPELARLESERTPTAHVYRMLQGSIQDRSLVDKSPTYLFQMESLRNAERLFHEPKYLFLVRHPFSVIESRVRMRMHRTDWGSRNPFPAVGDENPWLCAEKVWTHANANGLRFLKNIETNRKLFIRYEQLVKHPKDVLQAICDFLGLSFCDKMLAPFDVKPAHWELGDPNQTSHNRIKSELAEAWSHFRPTWPLNNLTKAIATHLGYPTE
jgi:hypothetical protein